MSLLLAVANGNYYLCNELISYGINVNQVSTIFGETPLWIASQHRKIEICQLLISSGANVNQTDDNGRTPLLIASDYGHLDICKLLISSGADVNQATNEGSTPLWVASCYAHKEICQLLISSGANVNQCITYCGETPLEFPLLHEDKKEVYQLLRHEISKKNDVSNLLFLERTFNSDSLFHEYNLPLDLFKIILRESYLDSK